MYPYFFFVLLRSFVKSIRFMCNFFFSSDCFSLFYFYGGLWFLFYRCSVEFGGQFSDFFSFSMIAGTILFSWKAVIRLDGSSLFVENGEMRSEYKKKWKIREYLALEALMIIRNSRWSSSIQWNEAKWWKSSRPGIEDKRQQDKQLRYN